MTQELVVWWSLPQLLHCVQQPWAIASGATHPTGVGAGPINGVSFSALGLKLLEVPKPDDAYICIL